MINPPQNTPAGKAKTGAGASAEEDDMDAQLQARLENLRRE